MTETINTVQTTVDTYFALWNEPDAEARRRLAEQAFVEGGRHVDPLADVAGHDDLSTMIAGVHRRFEGHALVRTSAVDAHHDVARYSWQLEAPDGTVVVTAVDIAELAPDGRFACVTAFFHDLPALESR